MLCVIPVRLPVLKLKILPGDATPVPHPKDTSEVASLISSSTEPHRDTSIGFHVTEEKRNDFGPFGLNPKDFTD